MLFKIIGCYHFIDCIGEFSMSKKISKVFFSNLAETRNHVLKDVSNPDTPAQGSLELKCNTCGKDFCTTAKSYTNARKTGCPHCKALKARKSRPGTAVQGLQGTTKVKIETSIGTVPSAVSLTAPLGPAWSAPTLAMQGQEANLARAQANTNARLEKRGEFQRTHQVYTKKDFVKYLEENKNSYSTFMLEKINNEAGLLANSKQPKEVHHIIPKHAGGPNAKWNLVYLTPEDHCKAHELRYGVFEEFGDFHFLQTQGSEVLSRIKPNPAFQAQLLTQRQNANKKVRVKFENDDGSQASQAVLAGLTPEAHTAYRERHQSQMSEPIRKVLQEGATFVHKRTNKTFVLEPRQAPTLTELKDLLAGALPVGDVDRVRLEKAAKPMNVTSAIGKMIKGVADRPSAYGWSLKK